MISPLRCSIARRRGSTLGVLALGASLSFAQTAPSAAPTAAELARYDANKNGRLDPPEHARQRADQDRARARVTSANDLPPARDEAVQLSPFEVSAGADRGYYASNTMSGTRLNSKIEDLASSITVVTKEQMADFAMLDINDIFNYEAGTEGTGNYTDFSIDRNGSPVDNTQLDPNNANRIRGIGNANISLSNFETSGRVPIDPINIDAVEISRGPNSNIFGLGNAAGTVNMVASSANTSRDRTQMQLRADSYGGYRSSLDLNRVLERDVLAVRGSIVHQHDAFVRKPSGTDTVRLNGMVRFQPFKSTTLTASHSLYRIHGRRTNATMPRDAVTNWREAGSPTWDPLTFTAFIDGQPVATAPTAGTLPSYFTNSIFATSGAGASLLQIDQGTVTLWTPSAGTATQNPNGREQPQRYVISSPGTIRNTQPLFSSYATVSSKELYDWSEINLAAMNYLSERNATTRVQLEHIFLNTPRQTVAAQLGWFREDADALQRSLYGVPGSSGATGYLQVDPNIRLLDGSPNPNFLRPHIGITGGYTFEVPLKNDTYRAQLAYRLDLTHEKNLLRWLGLHQVSAYNEYKQHVNRRFAFRDVIVSDHAWLPPDTVRANQGGNTWPATNRVYYQYYVGDSVGQNVDYAPTRFSFGNYPYVWGNAATGDIRREPAELGSAASVDGTSGQIRVLKTYGGVLQSHLLKGRIVTTIGLRQDRNYAKRNVDPRLLPDGQTHDYAWDNQWEVGDWRFREGRTKTAGVVVKPFRWLNVHANKSDSFQPSSPAADLYLESLPDPTGRGEDYGFALNLFGGKLVVRANQYTTRQINSRNGQSATLADRALKLDIYDFSTSRPFGLNFRARNWIRNDFLRRGITPTEQQLDAAVAETMKMPIERIKGLEAADAGDALPISQTDDLESKGKEIEIHYNPTNYWTVKVGLTETKAIDASLAANLAQHLAERLPVWQSIIDLDTGLPWFSGRYLTPTTGTTAASYLAGSVTAPMKVAKANEGKSRPQIRRYRANLSTNYRLAGVTDHAWLKRFNVGGALRWEDKGAIGYYGVESLPAVITELDPTRPVYAKANLYADAFIGYRTRLFRDRVNTTFQLNVRNLQESGRLRAISAFPDGSPNGFRIVDPRQFILTATFDL